MIPKALHPNPDIKRKNWLNLNGVWEFSFGEPVYNREITVPFSWTCPLSGINENKDGIGWYRKKVSFDFEQRLFLIINACDYENIRL